MRLNIWAGVAAVAVVLLAVAAPVHAQDDQLARRLLDEERAKPNGQGMAIVGASFSSDSTCHRTDVEIGRVTDGKYQLVTRLLGVSKFFGKLTGTAPKAFTSGEYVIGRVKCELGPSSFWLAGPHAKFQVRPGEVVDAGMLWIERKTDNILTGHGSATRSVRDTVPVRLAELRKDLPLLMQRVVKRPMTLIGPPTTNVKPSGLF